ncbi:MAG: hypothetical protein EA360_07985 [Balneolaceae bacterium]|nr:MAG: hypothetical protein EA360_07985 [Balneolaceae bacterium]
MLFPLLFIKLSKDHNTKQIKLMNDYVIRENPDRPLLKFFRFIGIFYLGFFSGAVTTVYLLQERIEWTSVILIFLALAFWGSRTRSIKSVKISEKGITFTNYLPFGGKSKTFAWDTIREVTLQKKVIELRNNAGSTEKLKLPYHSKQQGEELREILENLSKENAFQYSV